jgi:hypothetical protein
MPSGRAAAPIPALDVLIAESGKAASVEAQVLGHKAVET